MPRAKSFNPDVVLDRAVELFWRSGYDGTSMTKLLDFMGISRQSLYDTFGDKRSLFLAALDRYRATVKTELGAQLERSAPLAVKIRATFDWVTQAVLVHPERRSCFMANSALELGQHDPEVRARVSAHLLDVEELFFSALEHGRSEGELARDRDTRALARFLTNSIHGLGVMARGGSSEPVLHDSIETTLSVLA